MSYQSLSFILFCAVALLVYYTVGEKRQLIVLAFANFSFYAFAGIRYLPFLIVTTVSSYYSGFKIDSIYQAADSDLLNCNSPTEKKEIRNKSKKQAKRFLLIALVVSVGLLAVCKYTLFTVNNINKICSLSGIKQIKEFNMILPVGISFYTFMAVSYVLDIYWKRYRAEKNFLMYAVYLSYFPHIVQGPIDRFNEFKEQINGRIELRYKNITYGSQLALWGFFKKIVVADRLGMFVNEAIKNFEKYDGIILVIAIAVYSIQIYADFSGCIDIVTGVSEMFGIKLRKNFNHPYFSRTMGEFWRRWHISLQEWFKDYIYYPVSISSFVKKNKKKLKSRGNKRGEELFASCFPVLVVWIITGIWHGAAWQFLAWGLFHAGLLTGSQIFEPAFEKLNKFFKVDTKNFGWHFFQMLRTFFLCCVGRIFFRANGLMNAFAIIKKMLFNLNPMLLFGYEFEDFGIRTKDVAIMLLSVLILLAVDVFQEKASVRETLSKQNIIFRWIIIFAGLFAVILFGVYGPGYDASSFIYEQF